MRAAYDRVPMNILCIQGPDTHDRGLLASSVRLYYVFSWTILELRSLTAMNCGRAVSLRLTTTDSVVKRGIWNMGDLNGVQGYSHGIYPWAYPGSGLREGSGRDGKIGTHETPRRGCLVGSKLQLEPTCAGRCAQTWMYSSEKSVSFHSRLSTHAHVQYVCQW